MARTGPQWAHRRAVSSAAEDYGRLLLGHDFKIGVWGAGYIGCSTLAHFARRGVAGLVLDTDPRRVQAVNTGDFGIFGLRDWLGFDVSPAMKGGRVRATLDSRSMSDPDVLVHFVCVPTEKEGRPFLGSLVDVFRKLAGGLRKERAAPPLIIVESTLTPGTTDRHLLPIFEASGKVSGKDFLLSIAPRRDWFVDGSKSLKELDRVFGGVEARSTHATRSVLSLVCDRLHAAGNHRVAEMVKSFENAYRHVEITLANQLSLAYPGENVREALRLVGTKWNIGTFYPGFGTGGYCIPLSSRYALAGAARPGWLGVLRSTLKTDGEINRLIARSIISRGYRSVGVLGLSYKANLKVPLLSPTLPFVGELLSAGIQVAVCDPLFSASEIRAIAGVGTFDFPRGMDRFEAIVAVVDHHAFRGVGNGLLSRLTRCRFILDNTGMWEEFKEQFLSRGIKYHVAGDAGWLGPVGGKDAGKRRLSGAGKGRRGGLGAASDARRMEHG